METNERGHKKLSFEGGVMESNGGGQTKELSITREWGASYGVPPSVHLESFPYAHPDAQSEA